MPFQHTVGDAVFHAHAIVEIECLPICNLAESHRDTGWRAAGDHLHNIHRVLVARFGFFFQRGQAISKRCARKAFRNHLARFDRSFKIGVLATRQRRIYIGGCDNVFAQIMQVVCGDRMGGNPALQAVAPADTIAGQRQIIAEIVMQMRQKRAAANIGEETYAGFRHRKQGIFRHDAVRSMDGNSRTAAHHNAIEERDIRFWKTANTCIETIFVAKKFIGRRSGPTGFIGCNHIAACTEGAPLTFENDTGDSRIIFPCLQCTVERQNHIMRKRIEGTGPRELHEPRLSPAFEADFAATAKVNLHIVSPVPANG